MSACARIAPVALAALALVSVVSALGVHLTARNSVAAMEEVRSQLVGSGATAAAVSSPVLCHHG